MHLHWVRIVVHWNNQVTQRLGAKGMEISGGHSQEPNSASTGEAMGSQEAYETLLRVRLLTR
jgi:hypothetical protein